MRRRSPYISEGGKMRSLHSTVLILGLAIFCACSHPVKSETGPSGTEINLPVSLERQTCPVWCWAASAAMIANYYNRPYSQCQIASIFLNKASSSETFCCGSDACEVCASRISCEDIGNLLGTMGFDAKIGGILPEQELQAELSARRPVIIYLVGTLTGHVVVAAGFKCPGSTADNCVYRILDPFLGEQELNYGSLVTDKTSRNWVFTIYGISPRSDQRPISPGHPSDCGN